MEEQKSYYQRNKERLIAREKEYYQKHKEERAAYNREYYQKNKEKIEAKKKKQPKKPVNKEEVNKKQRIRKRKAKLIETQIPVLTPMEEPVVRVYRSGPVSLDSSAWV
jgi:hypothetical protein